MTFVEILIALRYKRVDNEIHQIFSFNGKNKYAKMLVDSRFTIYKTFERKIYENSINIPGVLEFSRTLVFKDEIVVVYTIEDENHKNLLKNKLFNVVGYVPKNTGCDNCIYLQNKTDCFFYCDFKQKTLTNKQKTCRWFKQKDKLHDIK
jgi:hypothetical protein